MNQETAIRILEVQEAFRNSPEFEVLWKEHQLLAERYSQVVARISEDDAGIITDFFAIVNEIHLKTLAFSVLQWQ